MKLADEIYKLTKQFPDDEKYGLISQMRRSAISIPSNIAEGYRRNSDGFYVQFLSVSYGSGGELETQIEICKKNLPLRDESYHSAEVLLEEVMKMLNSLISKLRATRYEPRANRGFTMVELLVAMSLFVVVISLVSGIFVRALRSQRNIVALIAANSNAALALEQIMREMRTGTDFNAPVEEEIDFTNAKDEPVVYKLETENGIRFLTRNNERLTAENVNVRKLNFILLEDPAFPPRITIILQLSPTSGALSDYLVSLQTTVSARIGL